MILNFFAKKFKEILDLDLDVKEKPEPSAKKDKASEPK